MIYYLDYRICRNTTNKIFREQGTFFRGCSLYSDKFFGEIRECLIKKIFFWGGCSLYSDVRSISTYTVINFLNDLLKYNWIFIMKIFYIWIGCTIFIKLLFKKYFYKNFDWLLKNSYIQNIILLYNFILINFNIQQKFV